MDILGDALVVAPLTETIELFSKFYLNKHSNSGTAPTNKFDFKYHDPKQDTNLPNQIYYYVFHNDDDLEQQSVEQRHGTMHGSELDYLFGAPIAIRATGRTIGHFSPNLTKTTDVSLAESMINIFTNFAKFG